jgi:hypothetical protein
MHDRVTVPLLERLQADVDCFATSASAPGQRQEENDGSKESAETAGRACEADQSGANA